MEKPEQRFFADAQHDPAGAGADRAVSIECAVVSGWFVAGHSPCHSKEPQATKATKNFCLVFSLKEGELFYLCGAVVLQLLAALSQTKKPGKVAQDTTSPAFTDAVNRLLAFGRFRFCRFALFRLAGLLFRVFFHLRFVAAYGLGHGSHSPEKIKLPEKAFLNFLTESPIWVARILVLPFSVPILSRSSKEKEHQKTIGVSAYVLLDNSPVCRKLYKKYRAVSERNQNNFSFIFKALPPGAGRVGSSGKKHGETGDGVWVATGGKEGEAGWRSTGPPL